MKVCPTLHRYGDFSDTNGIAALSELTKCIITQERNADYKLEAEMPVASADADKLEIGKIIMAMPDPYAARTQPFRISKIKRAINGKYAISAEHISRKLNGVLCAGFTAGYANIFLRAITQNAQLNYEPVFEFSTNISRLPDSSHLGRNKPPRSAMSLLCAKEDSLCTMFPEGTLVFDREQVRFRDDVGANRGAIIDYGINMASLSQELSAREFPTSGYPYYYRKASDNAPAAYVELPEKVLQYELVDYSDIDYTEPIDLTSKFSEPPTESELREAAMTWINENFKSAPQKTVKVERAYIPNDIPIQLCDVVRVRYPRFRIDAEFPVVSTQYDAINDKYAAITLGELRRDLADTILTLSKR